MTIPLMRPWFGPEESEAAAAAVASGWVAQGPRVREFEEAVAARVGADEGVAVNSGTAALHLALLLAGIGPGDEVVVPSLSYIATTSPVTYVGATPVFADVDSATQNLTAETVAPALTPRTKAVIVVHQAGMPADLEPLAALCRSAGVLVIEDAACALGATYRSRPIGGHSSLVALSFHPRKIITTGEGGMLLVSGQPDWAERARRLREHGVSDSAWSRHRQAGPSNESYAEIGFNLRMSDVHAAIGLVQLDRLDEIVARRRWLAARYHDLLSGVPGLVMARDPEYGEANYQSFWVRLPEDFPLPRDGLLSLLAERGVSARRGIMATHREPPFAGLPTAALPVTDALADRTVILPLFHTMEDVDQRRVAEVVREAAGLPTR